jgi:hypothetical protein
MLTECINLLAISGRTRLRGRSKESVERLTMAEARATQRKTTLPNLWRPGNVERAERKTSMQIKKDSTALARYTAQ